MSIEERFFAALRMTCLKVRGVTYDIKHIKLSLASSGVSARRKEPPLPRGLLKPLSQVGYFKGNV